jgi:hypothetical protein
MISILKLRNEDTCSQQPQEGMAPLPTSMQNLDCPSYPWRGSIHCLEWKRVRMAPLCAWMCCPCEQAAWNLGINQRRVSSIVE